MVKAPDLEIRRIPIERIDPPTIAMREKMSDEGLDALTLSMKRHGQLQNIGVIVAGDRFRVLYGHRRYVAAERAGLHTMIARVFPEGTTDEYAMMIDENEEQEPVNAAAQATYYLELLEQRCDNDVRKLVTLVKRTENFVLTRLDLTRGDPDVLAALRNGTIVIGVAQELNKVDEPLYRRLFLHDAVEHGLSIKALRVLRQQRDRDRYISDATTSGTVPIVAPSTEVALAHMDACILCLSVKDQNEMTYMKVHRSCRDVWIRQKAEARAGGAEQE